MIETAPPDIQVSLEEWAGDDRPGDWCYEDPARPGYGLCGRELDDQTFAPAGEVPVELVCETCLKIRNENHPAHGR